MSTNHPGLLPCWWKYKLVQPFWKTVVHIKAERQVSCNPLIPLVGIWPDRRAQHGHITQAREARSSTICHAPVGTAHVLTHRGYQHSGILYNHANGQGNHTPTFMEASHRHAESKGPATKTEYRLDDSTYTKAGKTTLCSVSVI